MNTSVPPSAPGAASGAQPPPAEDQLDRFFRTLRTIGLHRSTEERWVGGVCGGLAERLRVDPLIIRAAFILLGLVFGAGITLYLLAWVLLPDRTGVILLQRALRGGDAAAIVLVVVAATIVVSGFGIFWGWGGPGPIVPVLLVVGVLIYLVGKQNRTDAPAAASSPGSTEPGAPEYPASAPGAPPADATPTSATQAERPAAQPGTSSSAVVPYAWAADGTAATRPVEPTTYTATSVGASTPTGTDGTAPITGGSTPPGGVPPAPGFHDWTPPPPPPPAPRRRKLGSGGTLIVLGLAAVAGSSTTLIANTTDLADVSIRLGIAAAAVTVGLGVIVSGIVGRRAGLASFTGLLLALVTALGAAAPKDFTLDGPHGEQTWRPTAAVAESYRMGAGEGRLDLRRLGPDDAGAATSPPTVQARVSLGSLRIIVPADLPVRVEAQVEAGSIRTRTLGSTTDSGNEVSGLGRNHTVTLGEGTPVLTVDADLGYGEIIIERAP